MDLVSRLQRAVRGVVRWESGTKGRRAAGKRGHRAELRKHEHCHTDRNNQATAFSEHCVSEGESKVGQTGGMNLEKRPFHMHFQVQVALAQH